MKSTLSFNDLRQMIGTNAYDIEGNKVGGIEEIFTDMDSGEPEWLGVKSGGLFGSKHVVVPIDGADRFEDGHAAVEGKSGTSVQAAEGGTAGGNRYASVVSDREGQ